MGVKKLSVSLGVVCVYLLCSACGSLQTSLGAAEGSTAEISGTPTVLYPPEKTATTATAKPATLWVSPAIPEAARAQLQIPTEVKLVDEKEKAALWFEFVGEGSHLLLRDVPWVYALVVPFPALEDDIHFQLLQDFWAGVGDGLYGGAPLWMTEDTYTALASVWGEAAKGRVEIVPGERLLEKAWDEKTGWAIIPFEELKPRWKVLSIDQQNLFDRDLYIYTYPLMLRMGLCAASAESDTAWVKDIALPVVNRDPQKMTVLALTGTTAMVRTLAERMEEKGIDYPAQKIGEILRAADITHISNEVSFYEKCPPAVPVRKEMRFCSDPSYIQLLKDVGTDLVELTGNHLLDWGTDPFLYTLDVYDDHQLPYYGGGRNKAEGQKPFLLEDHGNRLAFIGCNAMDPQNLLASKDRPGAAPCDLDEMSKQIADLKELGYQVVITFQHFELDEYKPQSAQRIDFQRMAREGAVIVSGSQAHFPQSMKFIDDSFIHYGLGNLFFDQMTKGNKDAFIDQHIFYDGRYIGTQIMTIVLEDYSQPRLMTEEERQRLLSDVFGDSDWQTQ